MNDANKLTPDERHVMAHATAWDLGKGRRLYRNRYCAGPGHDQWLTLQELCARGLMVERKGDPLTGTDSLFIVTEQGLAALGAPAGSTVSP